MIYEQKVFFFYFFNIITTYAGALDLKYFVL